LAHRLPLNGEYAGTGSHSCLTAVGGFNSALEPEVPANASASSTSDEGDWMFNGAGSVSATGTNVGTVWLGDVGNAAVPCASGDTSAGRGKYVVDAAGDVTVTLANVKGKFFAGPRAGQTFVVNKIVLTGHASGDGATVTLATTTPAVETITFSNGDVHPRICHRSLVLLKH
jgi:hypothetical protein